MPLSEQESRCVELLCHHLNQTSGGQWRVAKSLDDEHPSGPSPDVLLMDEPTAGLSAGETQGLIPLIGRLGEALTIVIIEHDIKFLMEVARTLTVFHQGRKLAEGGPEEIRANEEVQEVYLRGTG